MSRLRSLGLVGPPLLVLLSLSSLACRGDVERSEPGAAAVEAVRVRGAQASPEVQAPPRPGAAAPAPAAPEAGRPLVAFLGDSLTAGMGLEEAQAFPAVVADRLAEQGTPIRVVNAGVSGDTSAGGLRRLGWLLRQEPAVLVVGLGANDGLRGLPVEETERNLREIVRRAQDAGVLVLLLGMKLPPNYGEYAAEFEAVYPRLARDLEVPLVPFLLDGVGGVSDLNLPDGLHPNIPGQERVAENVVPHLRDLLAESEG